MNTNSAQLDLISNRSEQAVTSEAVPEADQSRTRDKSSDPWPGVAPPAGWFLRAARVTAAPQGPVSVPSSTDRESGEPRIETGPGVQAPVPSPADPHRPPVVPRPRRSPETSVWLHSYHLWADSGIPWQQPAARRGAAPAPATQATPRPPAPTPVAQAPSAPAAATGRAGASYTARHARIKPGKQPPSQPHLPPAPAAQQRQAAQHEPPTPPTPPTPPRRPRQDTIELPAFAAAQFLGAPVQLGSRNGTTSGPGDRDRRGAGRPGTGTMLLDRPPAAPPVATLGALGELSDQTSAPYRPRLMFGRRALALGVPVLVLAMVATAAVALLTGHGPNAVRASAAEHTQSAQQVTMPGYPAPAGRGIFAAANRIVMYGSTAVVTAQSSTDPASPAAARQRFFISGDAGATWRVAQMRAMPGGPADPALGHAAPLVAGGASGWVAIGPRAIWTSQSGTTWTLRAGQGISQLPGDQVRVVTATASGFLAGGASAGGQAVVWTSADGVTWHRSTPDLGGVTAISYATAYAGLTLITGVRPDGTSGAWLSTDGGATWTETTIPVTHGAAGPIAGVAADPAGLLAVRDGTAGDAITFFSQNGRTWLYAGTLGASGGLRPRVVKGNGYGLVVAGQDNTGQLVAYRDAVAPQQATWRPTAILGNAAAETVVGAAVAPGDSVIAIGATAATPVTQQPVFVRATASSVTPVSLPPAAPEMTVNAAVQAGDAQFAVGSANGYPAIWRRMLVNGSWTAWSLVTSQALFGQQVLGTLTSITRGPSSWLAVGRVSTGSITLTSPDGATWHVA